MVKIKKKKFPHPSYANAVFAEGNGAAKIVENLRKVSGQGRHLCS